MPSYYSTTSKEAPAAAPSAAPQWFPRGAAAALLVAAGAFLLTLGAAQLATALYGSVPATSSTFVARMPSAVSWARSSGETRSPTALQATASGVYDFAVKDAKGKAVNLASFKGKVLLIVNVASRCGFTPQYKGLQALQEKYAGKPFSVVAFPCNQFGGQEPGTAAQVCDFAANNFAVTFPIMDKTEVNGENASPLFQYLKKQQKAIPFKEDVAWNFEKFLVDRSGNVVKRYSSVATPESIAADIEKLL